MMQEYTEEDGFFFEEDKMWVSNVIFTQQSLLLLFLYLCFVIFSHFFLLILFPSCKQITIRALLDTNSSQKSSKKSVAQEISENNPFPTNNQLPEANLYDGICGEIVQEASASSSFTGPDTQYFMYEARNVKDYEKLERDRLWVKIFFFFL